jgi:hypothetical protein
MFQWYRAKRLAGGGAKQNAMTSLSDRVHLERRQVLLIQLEIERCPGLEATEVSGVYCLVNWQRTGAATAVCIPPIFSWCLEDGGRHATQRG